MSASKRKLVVSQVVDPTKVERDINKLVEPFKSKIVDILELLKEKKIPVELFETIRTVERQKMLVKQGFSKTMKSKHLLGNAADLVYKDAKGWSWDMKRKEVAQAYYDMVDMIKDLNDKRLRLGQTWGDWPHIESLI